MQRFTILCLILAGCTFTPAYTLRGEPITCGTDPATGLVLTCEPGTGSGSGSAGGTMCHDIDEDGDGEPHDVGAGVHDHVSGDDHPTDDRDGDGIPNEDDCDEHPGQDDAHH